MKEIVLGIDLGTTYSCAAYLNEGKPTIIPSEKGYATVPSVVGLSRKGELMVGHPALEQMVTKPEDTIYAAKRLIGRQFNSFAVQKIREFMTYSIVEGEKGEAAVMLGGKRYSLQQISGMILAEIRDVAQRQLGAEIRRAVITVPAYYSDSQRQAVKEAGTLAGLQVERIVNEPTAAAVAYGYNRGIHERVLVYDLGGGTFDVSVLQIEKNDFKVLATGGDTFLGGVDFDTRITAYILEKFHEASHKDISGEKIALQRVRSSAERAKRDLSSEQLSRIHLPFITELNGDPIDLQITLNRDQINKLTNDLIDRSLSICDDVLGSIGVKPGDLSEVLLVGGQTRMPLVQTRIEKHFGRKPRKGVHPDEVVALGAAILSELKTTSAVELHDVLSIPIGIALTSGKFKMILERNTPIPVSKSYKVSLAPGRGLEIDVYQGESPSILENEYLGTFNFPATGKGSKERRLEIRFDLSAECLLNLNARDLDTGETSRIEITTLQTPKSLKEGLQEAMQNPSAGQGRWLTTFAKRVLGPKGEKGK